MKKNTREKQKVSGLSVGSKGYVGILIFLCIICLYVLFMALAIMKENSDTAFGFIMSQSILFLLTIVMLWKQIRYMSKNHIVVSPIRGIRALRNWFIRFLCPVNSCFKEAPEDQNSLERQITAFRREYIEFYQRKELKKNVTQLYRHLLILHRKRLNKMGIFQEYELIRMRFGQDVPVKGIRIKDGKFRHTNAKEYLTGKQRLIKNGKTIFHLKKNGSAEYDIIGMENYGAEKTGLKFICPGCGAVSSAEELLAGCSYCGKKFLIEELKDRICNLSFYRDPDMEERLAGLRISGWVNRVTFAYTILQLLGFFSMFSEVFIQRNASLRELPIAILLTVLSLLLIFWVLLGVNHLFAVPFRILIYKIYKKMREKRSEAVKIAKRNQKMANQIHQMDSDFSINSFFSNVRNKLAAVHFAENEKQVGVFAATDLKAFISSYQDVAECIFGPIELKTYDKRGETRTVNVTASLRLLRWNGTEIKEEEEKVELVLVKSGIPDIKNPFGIHSIVCSACGASVDLMEGNICSYCGNPLDVLALDWCIISYKIS